MTRGGWEIIAALVVMVLGSLLHFTYEWSGKSDAVAWFSATDESVNSHLALVNLPFLIMTLLIWWFNRDQEVWFSRACGYLVILIVIPSVFYAYTVGQTRESILGVDISLFLVAVALGGLTSWLLTRNGSEPVMWKTVTGISIHVALFIWFVVTAYTDRLF